MTRRHPDIVIKWHGLKVDWHSYDLTPEDNSPAYFILCTDAGHFMVTDQVELYINNKLHYHSPDVWYSGHIKPY